MENNSENNQNVAHSMSALQRHVEFFDRNKDGIIYPSETYKGFRAIGIGIPLSLLSAFAINVTLSYKTLDSKIPNLRFPIYIKNIKHAIHGNDSGVYDEEGRFVSHRFEELFQEFAKTCPDRLSWEELKTMRQSFHRNSSLNGKFASQAEWSVAYIVLKDKDGYVHKEDLRRLYDGTIFYYLEEKNSKK